MLCMVYTECMFCMLLSCLWICFHSYHDHNNIINNFNCFMFSCAMAVVLISFLVCYFLYYCSKTTISRLIFGDGCRVYFFCAHSLSPLSRSLPLFVRFLRVVLFHSRFLYFIAILDRISLSRNVINQFYLYKTLFSKYPCLYKCCVLLTLPISNWTECVFYALHFVDLYETFCTMKIYILGYT